MNLSELRSRIKNLMDYQPELLTYSNQVDTLINDAYMSLWISRQWIFAQRTSFLDIYPDITYANQLVNASVANMSRKVTFSGPVYPFDDPRVWEGQVFQCQGREYEILKIVSNTQLRLSEAFRGTTNVDDVTWTIKHRYYDMPQDCVDVLTLAHRDVPYPGSTGGLGVLQGKLVPVSARREADLNLREDMTSTYSEGYVNLSPHSVPSAEKLTYTSGTSVSSDLPDSVYYEFCWAFIDPGNRVGPLSDSLIVQSTTGNIGTGTHPTLTLQFMSHDNLPIAAPAYSVLPDTNPNPWEGKSKRLYFNQNFNRTTGERLGLPLWREVTQTGSMPNGQYDHLPLDTIDETSTVTVTKQVQLSPGNARYIETDGQIQTIRPFPRPLGYDIKYVHVIGVNGVSDDAVERLFRRLELRYVYKPPTLCSITDSPEMPYDMHQLIVYRALEDLFIKANNMPLAENYRRRFSDEVKRAENRYLNHKDMTAIRGQFGPRTREVRWDVQGLVKLN